MSFQGPCRPCPQPLIKFLNHFEKLPSLPTPWPHTLALKNDLVVTSVWEDTWSGGDLLELNCAIVFLYIVLLTGITPTVLCGSITIPSVSWWCDLSV